MTADAHFVFPRDRSREADLSRAPQPFEIFGMEYSFTKVGLHGLTLGKAGQLKDTSIHVEHPSVSSQDDDIMPDGIDNLPQMGFGVLDSFERHLECRLRLFALDGYRGDAARIINQSNIVGSRTANFPIVH